MTRHRLAVLAASAALGAGALAGCSSSQVGSSGNQGFVSGNGVMQSLKVADRSRPGPVSGTTLAGKKVSLSDYRGQVVVVNVWGSWCSECQKEAPALVSAARELAKHGVRFLGIDSRDSEKTQPRAFQSHFDVPYDSIYDPDGVNLLAFHGTLPPKAIPSTVVIDKQGRVAGIINGEINRTSLVDLVEDVAQGKSA